MPEKSRKVGRTEHIEKNSWKKSHKAKRTGYIEEKCSKKSRLTGIRGHEMKEILYMSRQIEGWDISSRNHAICPRGM